MQGLRLGPHACRGFDRDLTSKPRLAYRAASRPEPAPTSKASVLVLRVGRPGHCGLTEAAESDSYQCASAGACVLY